MNIPTSLRRAKAPLALTAAVMLAASACGGSAEGSENGSSGSQDLSGTIKVDGSSTVAPLSTAAEAPTGLLPKALFFLKYSIDSEADLNRLCAPWRR